MKRLMTMCCMVLCALITVYAPANAQLGGVGIYGGLALPTGDFAGTKTDENGYAMTGFAGGLEFTIAFPIDIPIGIGWITSVTGTYNDYDIKKFLEGITISNEYTPWYAAWGMTGGAVSFSLSPLSLYGTLQLGGVAVMEPEITVKYAGLKATRKADLVISMPAFSIGAGVGLGPLRAGLRYLDAGEVEFEEQYGGTGVTTTKHKVKIPMSVVMLTAGLEF